MSRLDLRGLVKRYGAVTALDGAAYVQVAAAWSDQLYRELIPSTERRVPVRLVPYFAWANREPSEMTVWIPLSTR